MTDFLTLRSAPNGPVFRGQNNGETLLWDQTEQKWYVGAAVGAVSSVFGRTGAVAAAAGDYDSDQIDNVSGVAGATVSDALDILETSWGMTTGYVRDATPYSFTNPTVLRAGADAGGGCQIFSGGLFSLPDSTKLQLTYNGPPGRAMIQVIASVNGVSVPGPMVWGVGCAINGDLIGQAVSSLAAKTNGVAPLNVLQDDDGRQICGTRATNLQTGDVLEVVFGTGDGTTRELSGLQIVIWTYPPL